MVNRFDTGLIVLPALVVAVWRAGWRTALVPSPSGCCRWRPGRLHRLFIRLPLPEHGVPEAEDRGARTRNSLPGVPLSPGSIAHDPLTLFTIGLALVAPLAFGGGWSMPAGILIYLVYIVRVGGDFISGRFLAAPFLLP